jgi:hypothetical protein
MGVRQGEQLEADAETAGADTDLEDEVRGGTKSSFDSAAVVRCLVGVRANGPGGIEGLALGPWEKKGGG